MLPDLGLEVLERLSLEGERCSKPWVPGVWLTARSWGGPRGACCGGAEGDAEGENPENDPEDSLGGFPRLLDVRRLEARVQVSSVHRVETEQGEAWVHRQHERQRGWLSHTALV